MSRSRRRWLASSLTSSVNGCSSSLHTNVACVTRASDSDFRAAARARSTIRRRRQQAESRSRKLVQQLLSQLRIRPRLALLDEAHLPVGRSVNDAAVLLEQFEPEQPVMIGRLVLGLNFEPFVTGIDRFHVVRVWPAPDGFAVPRQMLRRCRGMLCILAGQQTTGNRSAFGLTRW